MSDAVDIKRARKQRAALKRKYAEISAVVERIHRQSKRLIHQRAFTCAPALELTQSDLADINKKYKAGVNEALTKNCKKVLAQLMESRLGFPFNAPVDTHKYTTYLDKVSTPMDFGTIKAKVEEGRYSSVEAFKADVMLVFSNARTFNPPGSDVYVMAEALQSDFVRSMREHLSKVVNSIEAKRKLDTESKKAEKYQSLVSAFRSSAEGDIRAFVKYLDECMLALRQAMSVSAAMTATQMPGPQDLAKLADDISVLPLKYQRILQHVLDDGTEMKSPPCAEDLGKKSSLMLLQAESVLARCNALNVGARDPAERADDAPEKTQAPAAGKAQGAAISKPPQEGPTSAARPEQSLQPASALNTASAAEPPAVPKASAKSGAADDAALPAAAGATPTAAQADAVTSALEPGDGVKPAPGEHPSASAKSNANAVSNQSGPSPPAANCAAAMDVDPAAPDVDAANTDSLPGVTGHLSSSNATPNTSQVQPDPGASKLPAANAQAASEPPAAASGAVVVNGVHDGQDSVLPVQPGPAATPAKDAATPSAQPAEKLPSAALTAEPGMPPPTSTAEAAGAQTPAAAAAPASASAPAVAAAASTTAAVVATASAAATGDEVEAAASAAAEAAAAVTATAGAAETDALKGASLPSIRVGAAAVAHHAGDGTPVLQPLDAGYAGAFLKSAPPAVSPRFPLPTADPNEGRGLVRNALNEAKVAWPLLPVGLGVPHVHINVNEIRRRMASNFIATRNLTIETNLVVRATNDPKSNIPLSRSANMDLALQLHRSLGNILPTSPLKRSSSTGAEELQHIAIQALAFPDPKKPLVPCRMPVVRRGAAAEDAAADDDASALFATGRLPDCMSPTPDVAAWQASTSKRRFRAPCHPKRSTLQAQRKDRAKAALQSLGLGAASAAPGAPPAETPTPPSPARRLSTGALPLMSPVLPSCSTDLARGESPRSLGKVTMKTVHAAMMAVKEPFRSSLDLSSSPRLAQLRTGSPRLAFQMDQELRNLTNGLSSQPSAAPTRLRERSGTHPVGSGLAASEAPVPSADPVQSPSPTLASAAQQPANASQPAGTLVDAQTHQMKRLELTPADAQPLPDA